MASLSHADVIAMMRPVGEITLVTEASLINAEPGRTLNWLLASVNVDQNGPCVYAWVEEAPYSAPQVLYVGKAGTSLSRRCREHSQGFRSAKRGRQHAAELWPKIRAGSRILIYALWPEPFHFAGHSIPSHSSVEDWLLNVIEPRPARNR